MLIPAVVDVHASAVLTVSIAPHTPAAERVRARMLPVGAFASETQAIVTELLAGETASAG